MPVILRASINLHKALSARLEAWIQFSCRCPRAGDSLKASFAEDVVDYGCMGFEMGLSRGSTLRS